MTNSLFRRRDPIRLTSLLSIAGILLIQTQNQLSGDGARSPPRFVMGQIVKPGDTQRTVRETKVCGKAFHVSASGLFPSFTRQDWTVFRKAFDGLLI